MGNFGPDSIPQLFMCKTHVLRIHNTSYSWEGFIRIGLLMSFVKYDVSFYDRL